MLPVIDVAPAFAGEPGAAVRAAEAIRRACEDVGFYVLVGHGLDPAVVERAFAANAAFFEAPLERRLEIRIDRNQSGFQPLKQSLIRSSAVAENTQPDVCEIVILRRDLPPDHPDVLAGRRFRQPNKWPAWMPEFREAFAPYLDRMEDLGRRLLPLYARALGLPDDHFAPFFREAQIAVSVAHYPPDETPAEGQYGLAPHTDAGFLTMIPQTGTPGLEIGLPSGEWIEPPAMPGAVLVNSGDMLRRWTNDLFLSTPHRVVVSRGRHRHSNPFFFNPSLDAVIDCLPTCTGPDRPPRHPPIRYEDHYLSYIRANYAHLKDDAEDAR